MIRMLKLPIIMAFIITISGILFLYMEGLLNINEVESFYCDERRELFDVELKGIYLGSDIKSTNGSTKTYATFLTEFGYYELVNPDEKFYKLIMEGDSIYKEKKSLDLKVYRKNKFIGINSQKMDCKIN